MKTEKIILSFVAILIGLLVAVAAFYLYENTKKIPPSKIKTISVIPPTPTSKPSIFLTVDEPKDEEVVGKKIIVISGKTTNDATVVILTAVSQEIISPTLNGDFSTTVDIESGQNLIEVTAMAPNGEHARLLRVVTFSTEEF